MTTLPLDTIGAFHQTRTHITTTTTMDLNSSLRMQPKMLVRRGDCRRLPAPRSNGLSGETCPEERGRADYSPPKYSPIGNTVYTVEPKGLLRRKCGPGLTAAGGRPRYTDDPLVGSVNRGEFVTPLKGRTKMAVREDRRYLDEDILHNLAQKVSHTCCCYYYAQTAMESA